MNYLEPKIFNFLHLNVKKHLRINIKIKYSDRRLLDSRLIDSFAY
jgi:hypothetical protein